jgi:hypothetical protein
MQKGIGTYRKLSRLATRDPLVLGWFVVLIACGSTEPIEKNLLLEGTITDAATGAAIAGSAISIGNGNGLVPVIAQSTTADAQGHYTLSHYGCINAAYVFAGAAGYFSDQARVGCMPGTQTIDFSLDRDPSAP